LLRSGSLEDLRAKAVFRKREKVKSVGDALRKGLEAVFLEDYFQPTQLEKLHQPPTQTLFATAKMETPLA
jgi:hypothetical protein